MACPMIPLTWVEAHIAALAGWQRMNPHARGRNNHPKRHWQRVTNTPHQHIQTHKEEGSEEVAVHMCLYVTVLLCPIKMLIK